jgi:hypothetical protein
MQDTNVQFGDFSAFCYPPNGNRKLDAKPSFKPACAADDLRVGCASQIFRHQNVTRMYHDCYCMSQTFRVIRAYEEQPDSS